MSANGVLPEDCPYKAAVVAAVLSAPISKRCLDEIGEETAQTISNNA